MGFWDDLSGDTAATAARQAAKVQTAGLKKGYQKDKTLTKKAVKQLKPYSEMGKAAVGDLTSALLTPGSDYWQKWQPSSGFDAAQNYAVDQLQQNNVTGGMLHSGGTLRSVSDFLQKNLLSEQHNQVANLFQAAGMGQNAATNQGNWFSGLGTRAEQNFADRGTAAASGIMGAANAQTQGATNIAGLGMQGLGTLASLFTAPISGTTAGGATYNTLGSSLLKAFGIT